MSLRKITEDEVRALWVQRLSDTPNRYGRFGTAGLSASEVKAAYDALPLRIVERFNELVDVVERGELAELIPAAEGRTLADFFRDVTSGELAAYLTADGERSLSEIAALLDTHLHDARYARLGPDGRLAAEHLPSGYESSFAAAEEERVLAERRREEAEAEREEALAVLRIALATLAENEEARDRRESEREARLATAEETLSHTATLAEETAVTTGALAREVACLAAAAEGATHTFFEDDTVAYRIRTPEGALPYARLLRLGGPEDGSSAPVKAIASHGMSLLPYPYPSAPTEGLPEGLTVKVMEDGSLIFNGYASRNVSYALYREYDNLYLPPEPIYIDSIEKCGLTLYVRSGSSGAVWKKGSFTPSPNDEYFGHYFVYIYIAEGSSFDNLRVVPSITRGVEKREAVPYRPPVRLEIPEEVRRLPGYGIGGNYLDIEEGVFRRRYSLPGVTIPEECYPLPEDFLASAWVAAQEDGEIVFENDRGVAVASTLAFGIRLV